ncbi:MAG TPA: hypothetical protein VFQ16_04600 [Burkholderiaceae bacterium]|nr:hypothetical protein [Burkholderiaceae bacterium]
MAARRSTVAIMLALALVPALAGESRTPLPVVPAAKAGTQCVADPATMRRAHPAMLKHQRDDTVRGGIRGAKASLKGCVDCHAGATGGSVAASDQDFCVACHRYAAVKVDCFECHSAKPQAAVARKP